MKYYKIEKDTQLPQIEGVEVITYDRIEGYNYVGVNGITDLFDEFDELTFTEISPILQECHLNKQLNLQISKRIKAKYSVDDEIALLKKADTDANKIAYNLFVSEIKTEIDAQKVKLGLK